MILFIRFLVIVLLIGATALFVAAEFALVKVRTSRLEQMVVEGVKNAPLAKLVHEHLDAYLSACQLGITLTSLALGWIGESTVEAAIHPIFVWLNIPEAVTKIVAFAIAFSIITFFHVVVGELVPKSFAISKTENVVLAVVKPLHVFYKTMYPFIWVLNSSAAGISRMLGFEFAGEGDEAHSEEELRLIASESFKHGDINQSELLYLNRIFDFDNRLANEVMIPRQEMAVMTTDMTVEEAAKLSLDEQFTRYPVMKDSKDDIVGVINSRDLFNVFVKKTLAPTDSIESLIQPILQVMETTPISDLLEKMKKEQRHIAILLDEYGGTEGLVTAEDILEEIVGEMRDEFDADEVPDIRKIDVGKYLISGKVLLETVEKLLHIKFEEDSAVSTIGGWILNRKYDVEQGDTFSYEKLEFTVVELENHTVQMVEVAVIES
ncbi:hemolysin family protein [Carnobacterium maltaromaticum]|uniref:hemolysin family protein n=1 Tax=Carnobacterium maltaromaticum TaxID=2751 RepID=UPI00191BC397|nr:hemolysin family protein [Carnobacterium maltaromaticum]CAD5902170.1 putative magnesium efflux pump [Carnobacterium maltaromaticum]